MILPSLALHAKLSTRADREQFSFRRSGNRTELEVRGLKFKTPTEKLARSHLAEKCPSARSPASMPMDCRNRPARVAILSGGRRGQRKLNGMGERKPPKNEQSRTSWVPDWHGHESAAAPVGSVSCRQRRRSAYEAIAAHPARRRAARDSPSSTLFLTFSLECRRRSSTRRQTDRRASQISRRKTFY